MSASIAPASALVTELADLLIEKSWSVTTAESCTGGLVAAALTDIAGSSAWFNQGVVSYANRAKVELLGVDNALLVQYGAVSQEVVEAMAAGALARANANVAVAVSGIAGPSGGSLDKPVGTVWIGWAVRQTSSELSVTSMLNLFTGDRSIIREAALVEALRGTIQRVRSA